VRILYLRIQRWQEVTFCDRLNRSNFFSPWFSNRLRGNSEFCTKMHVVLLD